LAALSSQGNCSKIRALPAYRSREVEGQEINTIAKSQSRPPCAERDTTVRGGGAAAASALLSGLTPLDAAGGAGRSLIGAYRDLFASENRGMDAVSIQRSYYAKTASAYDNMHGSDDEHF